MSDYLSSSPVFPEPPRARAVTWRAFPVDGEPITGRIVDDHNLIVGLPDGAYKRIEILDVNGEVITSVDYDWAMIPSEDFPYRGYR